MLECHTFVARDGRHLYVYGELRGTPTGQEQSAYRPAGLHKRRDLLTGAWVAVSPTRNIRPHSRVPADDSDDATCPFCPGGAEVPFSYEAAVFDNRFPSFAANPPPVAADARIGSAVGRCEVVLYTEHHDGSLASLTPVELARVLAIWRDRTTELWADPRHHFVMTFENRGEAVGATLSHPHGQIYAFDHLPPLIVERATALHAFRVAHDACLGCHIVAMDDRTERVVEANDSFVIAVPFAARWPFEVHVRARRHGLSRLADLAPVEQRDLAAALRGVVIRYGRLFDCQLPYMMVALEAPEGEKDWHLAFEFYPPHRGPHLTKVRASVETATGLFINDTLPESNARRLAELPASRVEERQAFTVVHLDT